MRDVWVAAVTREPLSETMRQAWMHEARDATGTVNHVGLGLWHEMQRLLDDDTHVHNVLAHVHHLRATLNTLERALQELDR